MQKITLRLPVSAVQNRAQPKEYEQKFDVSSEEKPLRREVDSRRILCLFQL